MRFAGRRPVAFSHELLLGCRIVHKQNVSVAPTRGIKRLAGALGNDVDCDSRLRGKQRKNVRQQPRTFDGCR
jgi:hypothetical protein